MKSAAQEKHPRIRGESYFDKLLERSDIGNIPAYAGKAPEIMEGALIFRKHPRIRGESPLTPVILYLFTETSPHTRGKLGFRDRFIESLGNIPAYAGKAFS